MHSAGVSWKQLSIAGPYRIWRMTTGFFKGSRQCCGDSSRAGTQPNPFLNKPVPQILAQPCRTIQEVEWYIVQVYGLEWRTFCGEKRATKGGAHAGATSNLRQERDDIHWLIEDLRASASFWLFRRLSIAGVEGVGYDRVWPRFKREGRSWDCWVRRTGGWGMMQPCKCCPSPEEFVQAMPKSQQSLCYHLTCALCEPW